MVDSLDKNIWSHFHPQTTHPSIPHTPQVTQSSTQFKKKVVKSKVAKQQLYEALTEQLTDPYSYKVLALIRAVT